MVGPVPELVVPLPELTSVGRTLVISLCNGISFAAISTPVLVRLSLTCLSFGTAIAVLAVLAVPVQLPLL